MTTGESGSEAGGAQAGEAYLLEKKGIIGAPFHYFLDVLDSGNRSARRFYRSGIPKIDSE